MTTSAAVPDTPVTAQSLIQVLLAGILLGLLVVVLPAQRPDLSAPGPGAAHPRRALPGGDPFDAAGLVRVHPGVRGPAFTLAAVGGGAASLETWGDRLVVLNFWATWCPPCKVEMPALEALWQRYRDRGLVVVAVTMDRGASAPLVDPYRRDYGMTFPILLDPEQEAFQAWRLSSIPSTFLIRPGGEVAAFAVGMRDWNSPEVRGVVESLLP